MNRFTLKQLKYFVTVVETESIAEASRQLHIEQAAVAPVSRKITCLHKMALLNYSYCF